MFIKITTSGPRKYVKIVESFRDEAGKPRQRVLATLGRLENIREGAADAVIEQRDEALGLKCPSSTCWIVACFVTF